MSEATWGDAAKPPAIDWRMSASLRDVPRGNENVAEVTSLERAVRAWKDLGREHQLAATLTLEHPVLVDGASLREFSGEGISALVEKLPG